MRIFLTVVASWCAWLLCAPLALAQSAAHPSGQAQPAVKLAPAPGKAPLDAHTQEDIQRHRGMAQAHAQAAQCLEAGQPQAQCQKQLQAACTGLALGKNCGMRHAH